MAAVIIRWTPEAGNVHLPVDTELCQIHGSTHLWMHVLQDLVHSTGLSSLATAMLLLLQPCAKRYGTDCCNIILQAHSHMCRHIALAHIRDAVIANLHLPDSRPLLAYGLDTPSKADVVACRKERQCAQQHASTTMSLMPKQGCLPGSA